MPPQLYQDIIDRVILELETVDISTLAAFCQLSRDCARSSRKLLYYELDLVDEPMYASSVSSIGGLPLAARKKRRESVRKNKHLWRNIQCVAISLDAAPTDDTGAVTGSNTPCEDLLKSVSLTRGIQHLYIQFGRKHPRWQGHFKVVESVREMLENMLKSPSMCSLDVDIHTQYGTRNPFPGWIFRSLSRTADKVRLHLRHSSRDSIIPGILTANSPPIKNAIPKRVLKDFELVVHNSLVSQESTERCRSILSGLCFNFALSKLERLALHRIDDDPTLWALPRCCAETLEDLTIRDYPNRHDHLFTIPVTHFSPYLALRSLTLTFSFNPINPMTDSCHGLLALFTIPSPPTLKRVRLFVDLGRFLYGHTPALFEPQWRGGLGGWVLLDEALSNPSQHPSLQAVYLEYKWSNKAAPQAISCMEPGQGQGVQEGEAWQKKVDTLFEDWKTIFSRVEERGLLRLSYKHTMDAAA